MKCQEKVFPGQKFAAPALSSTSPGSYDGKQSNRSSAFRLRRRILVVFAPLVLVISLIFPSDLFAQVGPITTRCYLPECKEELTFSWGVMPLYQFPSEVNGGGTLSVFSVMTNFNVSKQVSPKLGVQVGFGYTYDSYKFSGLEAFPIPHPWSSVNRFGLDATLTYAFAKRWNITLVPAVEYAGEPGAPFGDSLVYGSVVAFSYKFTNDIELGMGVGVYYNLETISVYPYPVIKYKLGEKAQFATSFPAGPAGPAGGEIGFNLNKHWTIGVGAAYRSPRFRLDKHGPIPSGVGEYQSIPIFAHVSYEQSPALKIEFYGGVSIFNEIYVNDKDGDELYRSQQHVAPLLGVMISGTL